MTTTDHKTIGIMDVVACFAFFFTGGLMALLMRGELATPGLQFLSSEQFNWPGPRRRSGFVEATGTIHGNDPVSLI